MFIPIKTKAFEWVLVRTWELIKKWTIKTIFYKNHKIPPKIDHKKTCFSFVEIGDPVIYKKSPFPRHEDWTLPALSNCNCDAQLSSSRWRILLKPLFGNPPHHVKVGFIEGLLTWYLLAFFGWEESRYFFKSIIIMQVKTDLFFFYLFSSFLSFFNNSYSWKLTPFRKSLLDVLFIVTILFRFGFAFLL